MKNTFLGTLVAVLFVATPLMASAATFSRQLQVGMSGEDVRALQTFLAKDPSIYPQGLVTGYFGFLTKAAVSNFQSKQGIAAVGRVGPLTMARLNMLDTGGAVGTASAPAIGNVNVSAGRTSATVNWNTNTPANGLVYYSAAPLTTYENTNSVTVSGTTAMTDTAFRSSQNVAITGLNPNTTYYYLVYTTDEQGDVSVTWPASFKTTN